MNDSGFRLIGENQVELRPVTAENWRDVVALEVNEPQREFVAGVAYYLALCHYDGVWTPLAVYARGEVVGFVMWGRDADDGSCWIGGLVIDRRHQGRGHGRAATQELIRSLRRRSDCCGIALSYHPRNEHARGLYASLGFRETGEESDGELVARLAVSGAG